MTLPRQGFHALLAAAILALSAPTQAEALAPMGPPTAEEAAAAAEAAKPAPPVAQPAPAKPAPWLAPRTAPKAATGKSAVPPTGRMLGLLIVLGTLAVAALYFKRRGKAKGALAKATQHLSVVTSTRIGPKAHAVILSVNGRQMLLGVTDSSVKRLAFIDEVEGESAREDDREPARRPSLQSSARLASQAVRAAAPEPGQSRSFAELLKTAFRKREPATDADPASVLAAETQDVVGGRPVPSNVRMLDVEGQAQGLVRRLSGPRA